MMAAAVTGPTPGNVSRSVSLAVLMLMSVARRWSRSRPRDRRVAVAPGFGTTICVPSVSGAARFSDVRSAPFLAPPGAVDRVDHAVARRELVHAGLAHPSGDVDDDRHGTRRRRARSTAGDRPTRPARRRRPAPRCRPDCGSDRMYQSPAPSSVATTTTTSPASSPRESESSRSRRDMRGTLSGEPTPAVTGVTPTGEVSAS